MDSWEEVVQKYISAHSDKIRRTTRPLRDHFGICYFTHHRIDAEGNYAVLVDRPDWAEHYVENQLYLADPFHGMPAMYESGICNILNKSTDFFIQSCKKVLSADTGVILIEKSEKLVEFYGFFANENTSSLSAIALNHTGLLYSFAAHFKTQFNDVLSQMSSQKISLAKLKGESALASFPISPQLDEASLIAFYSDLGFRDEVKIVQKLTPRERQCLKLLLDGKSAKETANLLGPTRRTIESYFETLKDKLACWSKQELFCIAKRLQSIGLLQK